MTQQNYEKLKPFYYIWEKYKRDSTIVNLSMEDKKQLELIYIIEHKVYGVDLSCPMCVLDMIRKLFIAYDKHI